MSTEELKAIAEFNRNVRWLKSQQLKEKWVTAQEFTKATGWSKYRMAYARKLKILTFKKSKTGGYLYDLNSLKP